LWSLYDAIRCPTLVLRGEQSDLVSAQVIAQMRVRGPRAQAVELPGIGHAPTLMHDDQIRIVADFLRAPVAA
jgi:pimeloyl-ACP methyl ester carboxylesterase